MRTGMELDRRSNRISRELIAKLERDLEEAHRFVASTLGRASVAITFTLAWDEKEGEIVGSFQRKSSTVEKGEFDPGTMPRLPLEE